jgi:hypothetical protein
MDGALAPRLRGESALLFVPEFMDADLLEQINSYRATAQTFGDAALDAMTRGDVGLARTASRQAAQYARIVQQLESGEKQVAPRDEPEGAPALGGE